MKGRNDGYLYLPKLMAVATCMDILEQKRSTNDYKVTKSFLKENKRICRDGSLKNQPN